MTPFSVTVIKKKMLPDIPSGSATLYYRDSLLIIGDDATYLYRLALPGYHYSKYPIAGTDSTLARISKEQKMDLEAAVIDTVGKKEYLFAFGSGSIADKRDSLMAAPLNDLSKQQFYSLQKLYEFLRSETNTSLADWNIEAAAISKEHLILFNRGTNALIKINKKDFGAFLRNGEMPGISSYSIKLPVYEGHLPGISGACTLANGDLLFCASVEATENWYDDGEVIGSYVGIIDPVKGKLKHITPVNDETGAPLKIKLESLEVIKETNELLKVVAVADNDNGTTILLQLEIRR